MTAILFSMVGYFNGNNKTVWVMITGADPDTSGTFAAGILYEYPAERKSDKDRSGCTGGNDCGNRPERRILYLSESG